MGLTKKTLIVLFLPSITFKTMINDENEWDSSVKKIFKQQFKLVNISDALNWRQFSNFPKKSFLIIDACCAIIYPMINNIPGTVMRCYNFRAFYETIYQSLLCRCFVEVQCMITHLNYYQG